MMYVTHQQINILEILIVLVTFAMLCFSHMPPVISVRVLHVIVDVLRFTDVWRDFSLTCLVWCFLILHLG